jgi:hypothetical protein
MDLIMPMVANNLDLFKKVLVEPELQKALWQENVDYWKNFMLGTFNDLQAMGWIVSEFPAMAASLVWQGWSSGNWKGWGWFWWHSSYYSKNPSASHSNLKKYVPSITNFVTSNSKALHARTTNYRPNITTNYHPSEWWLKYMRSFIKWWKSKPVKPNNITKGVKWWKLPTIKNGRSNWKKIK